MKFWLFCFAGFAVACLVVVTALLFLKQWRSPVLNETRPSVSSEDGEDGSVIQFHEVTKQSGIRFVHTDGSSGRRYIVETVSAGLAIFDFDGDGLLDIYFLNGAPLPGCTTDTVPSNALYKNLGNWKFADVTKLAGVGDASFALGVAVADYDNDGDADLFVNNYGANVLYQNNGDGTFTDVTKQAGVTGGKLVGAGACFLDIEQDGDLDLYVANYVKFTEQTHATLVEDGFPKYITPKAYPAVPDILYRNNGDGTFTDISQQSGVGPHAGTGMGLVCCDYDNDRDTDIFVLNDVSGNFFFQNDGFGKFKEMGLLSGAAYNSQGDELGSMGIDCGDYNNDGWLDFLMTSYQNEYPVLYKNLGEGILEDATHASGIGERALHHVNWGVGIVDFNNDGNRDIYIACGHLQDNIGLYDDSTSYLAQNVLLKNLGNGKFIDVTSRGGDGMLMKLSSRGAAFDDLDNDGRIDVVVLNSRHAPTLLRNITPPKNHWIQIQLEGVKTNRDGVGARVQVIAGDLKQYDEVHSGRGYQSHYGTRLHFGLGQHERIDRIEVYWIGGGTDILRDIEVDQLLKITEGMSKDSGERKQRGS